MQLGSMFISNCNIRLHVSDAFCVHPQKHLRAATTFFIEANPLCDNISILYIPVLHNNLH